MGQGTTAGATNVIPVFEVQPASSPVPSTQASVNARARLSYNRFAASQTSATLRSMVGGSPYAAAPRAISVTFNSRPAQSLAHTIYYPGQSGTTVSISMNLAEIAATSSTRLHLVGPPRGFQSVVIPGSFVWDNTNTAVPVQLRTLGSTRAAVLAALPADLRNRLTPGSATYDTNTQIWWSAGTGYVAAPILRPITYEEIWADELANAALLAQYGTIDRPSPVYNPSNAVSGADEHFASGLSSGLWSAENGLPPLAGAKTYNGGFAGGYFPVPTNAYQALGIDPSHSPSMAAFAAGPPIPLTSELNTTLAQHFGEDYRDGSLRRPADRGLANSLAAPVDPFLDVDPTRVARRNFGLEAKLEADTKLIVVKTSSQESTAFGIAEFAAAFGSTLGRQLAGDDLILGVFTGSLLGTVGLNIGQQIDASRGIAVRVNVGAGYDATKATASAVWADFTNELSTFTANAAIGSLSSYLSIERGEALGLEGFGAELFNTRSGALITHTLNNLASHQAIFNGVSLNTETWFASKGVTTAGMRAQVEIITRRRSLMDYLLSPIARATQEAGRER